MRKAIVGILAAGLLVPAAATAKERIGDARVVFTPAPSGLRAGQAWNVKFRFYFKSGQAWYVSGLHPWVTIRNTATGRLREIGVAQVDSTYYSARVVFPSRGTWTVTFHFDENVGGGARRLATLTVR